MRYAFGKAYSICFSNIFLTSLADSITFVSHSICQLSSHLCNPILDGLDISHTVVSCFLYHLILHLIPSHKISHASMKYPMQRLCLCNACIHVNLIDRGEPRACIEVGHQQD